MHPTKSIRDIDRGIVFLMAPWSGSATAACHLLEEFVGNCKAPKPHLVKIELREQAAIYELPELKGRIHGWGEAMVVKSGQIVYFTVLGKELAGAQVKCRELLKVYEA